MNICIISSDYPDKRRSVYPFVKQLVDELARQGHICQVVAPYSIIKNRSFHIFKEIQIIGEGKVIIYRPNCLSFSSLRIFGVNLSLVFHRRAINRALSKLETKPDVVYGHFWEIGYSGYNYAKKHDLPLFVATGESSISKLFDFDKQYKDFCNYVNGVICVSSKNLQESIDLGLTSKDKCVVIPNAIDTSKFYLKNKQECRKQLSINENEFVVVFVGSFIERKGVLRVAEAIRNINDPSVKSIFIGGGDQDPICEGILFKGRLPHNEISTYLNAADVFVLPTLAEGCCNAIIEAMACGLPIVSSNLAFNWDILNDENSIMIDPNSINEIANAITRLKSDIKLRKQMSAASLYTAKGLTINQRAKKVLSFIKENQ